jgi:RHS repeat-associated protein
VLATYVYDDLGRRTSLTRGDGSVLGYSYDAVSRLSQLADNLSGTTYDQTLGFSYTPASQIAAATRSNDNYAWGAHYNVTKSYTTNGLNQFTVAGSASPTYDTKGNLTSAGSTTFSYSSENLLTGATGSIALAYDPALRLYQTSGGASGTTRLAYDGSDLIAEYNSSNAMMRRYVHGPGNDEPIAWYEGSGTTDRRFLHQDERGSVVAVTNSSGTVLGVNSYDEYGVPASANMGRFQYTGQTWLSDLGLYYYKARMYSSGLGRFLQTDPIGYASGLNTYNYAAGDSINMIDPEGTRGMTAGEKRNITAILGNIIPVDDIHILFNYFSDRGYVGPRNVVHFGETYVDDFSQVGPTTFDYNSFLDEFWHIFEKEIGRESQADLILNQITFGFSNSAYNWVDFTGVDYLPFEYQNAEVRAQTFADCFTGSNLACSRLEGYSYTGDYRGGTINVSFASGSFTISYTYVPIGSHVRHTETFNGQEAPGDRKVHGSDKKKGH